MVRRRHDEMHRRRFIPQALFQCRKQIPVIRSPSIRLRRLEIRIPIEMVEPLRQGQLPDIIPGRRTTIPEIDLITQFFELRRHRRRIDFLEASWLVIRPDIDL